MNAAAHFRSRAVALGNKARELPRVTARGDNELADRIIAVAREHGIPVQEEPDLVALLSQVPLGDEVPEAVYLAVSEILAFTFSLDKGEPGNLQDE